MTRWYGKIGFAVSTEETPGVWVESIIDRPYYGVLTKNTRRLRSSDKVNDDITIDNELSVLIDPYAYENFHSIRYAEFMNTKWKVNTVEVQYPRLVLELGGVWNGQ